MLHDLHLPPMPTELQYGLRERPQSDLGHKYSIDVDGRRYVRSFMGYPVEFWGPVVPFVERRVMDLILTMQEKGARDISCDTFGELLPGSVPTPFLANFRSDVTYIPQGFADSKKLPKSLRVNVSYSFSTARIEDQMGSYLWTRTFNN